MESQLNRIGEALPGPSRSLVNLALISVLTLYLELLLIRWISTEIRLFAYLQNIVLVVCFLGLGVGFFSSKRQIWWGRSIVSLLLLALLFVFPPTRHLYRSLSGLLAFLHDYAIWEWMVIDTGGLAGRVALFVVSAIASLFVMILIAEPFIPLGRLIGRLMDEAPRPIVAYSVNVAGSLAGIWLFAILSVLEQPPAVWFALLGLMYMPYMGPFDARGLLRVAALIGCVVAVQSATRLDRAEQVLWSPYQKLALISRESREELLPGNWVVEVNNASYQGMLDLGDASLPPDASDSLRAATAGQYEFPYLFHSDPGRVLIVGSGTGNDVAGALRSGVDKVVAVEIDPAIIELGREFHPERPYDDARVEIVVDDARSFFSRNDDSWDVVVFGLLDSHTTNAMTNARLDHFVYTVESLELVKEMLAPGGVVFLTFEAQQPYIGDRIAGALRQVFGRDPEVFWIPQSESGWGGLAFVVGRSGEVETRLAENPELARRVEAWQKERPVGITYTTRLATDDWPYLYLDRARIPLLYGLFGLLTALLLFRLMSWNGLSIGRFVQAWNRDSWHFFFLGAGFLLLEVQNISKASVVLGNTWLVNAVIITGVLAMILLANLTVLRHPALPLRGVWFGLLASVVALYFFDLALLGSLPYAPKALLVGGITTLPMFFAGIVFARSFAVTPAKDHALGANLWGALAGAGLQAMSFLSGVRFLLVLVLGFYLLALLTAPRFGMQRSRAPGEQPWTPASRSE
jgi:spermidine synthase